jgi:uncharacterized membrane protein
VSNSAVYVVITTFLASAVEAIEMVTIVVGVGATRGWRSTLYGAAAGFGVLAVTVVALGAALTRIPIGPLRLVVGGLLLVFGLQWYTKGVRRVALRGFAGYQQSFDDEERWRGPGTDWTAFLLGFKGVLLEGLEVAFIVVTFGITGGELPLAVIAGVGAVVIVGGIGFVARGAVSRIPRSLLQLIVGILLTSFGTFWSLEGIGVDWPGGDVAIIGLIGTYTATALLYIGAERRRLFGLVPVA